MRLIVSNKGCEFECGHRKKIVAFNFFGLAHTARPETKFGLRRKLLRMLSWRFLGPVYTVLKNHEHTGISLVCLIQMAACTLVRRYVGRTDFWFKINYRQAFALTILRKYRPGLSERPMHDFLLATNQRAQFRLWHNLDYNAVLASLINKNIDTKTLCGHRNLSKKFL